MVFLCIETTNMTDNQLICQVQSISHFCMFILIKRVGGSINCIIYYTVWCSSEHPITCIPSTSKKVCSISRNTSPIPKFNRIFYVLILICVMTVCNPNRNIMLRSNLKNNRTQTILMDVDDFIFGVFIKEVIERT